MFKAFMKKWYRSFTVIILLLLNYRESSAGICPFSPNGVRGDSNKKHEILITPAIGYGELPLLESPMSYVLFYNNEHNFTTSPEIGCSVDYPVIKNVNLGLDINEQIMPFASLSIKQPYYSPFPLYPYTFSPSPIYGCSVDYVVDNNVTAGLILNFQTIKSTSQSAPQPIYYPYSLQFNCYDMGIRKVFYFKSDKINNLYFYLGARGDVSLWNEADNWSTGYNNQYNPIITSANKFQLQLLLIGGMRYFILPSLGTQIELGYGFGTPYYAQLGIVIRINS
jgi:hypothetical protein